MGVVVRIALILPLVLALAACNSLDFAVVPFVSSDSPWFTREAGANAAHLRAGVWVMLAPGEAADPTCSFDEREPMESWPDCVAGQVVHASEILSLHVSETDVDGQTTRSYDWQRTRYVLADGEPRIEQLAGCFEPAPDASVYCYEAVRPTIFDRDGRIVAFNMWPVLCAPGVIAAVHQERATDAAAAAAESAEPDEPQTRTAAATSAPSEEPSQGTAGTAGAEPFPGLHRAGGQCVADSEESLRNAARANEAVTAARSGIIEAHWVRDGDR
jgi:hypothetical protein